MSNNRILAGLALTLAALSMSASAQAAADYALTHSASSTATNGIGSGLTSTINQSMNRISRRIQDKVEHTPQNQSDGQRVFPSVSGAASVPKPAPPAPAAPATPSGSPFGISIQGGEVPCAVTPANGKTQVRQANSAPSNPYMYCRNYNSSAQDANTHPSVVTLHSVK